MRPTLIGTMLLAVAGMPAISASTIAAGPVAADAGMPASQAAPGHAPTARSERNRPKVVEHYVDLNSASRTELMTLPGIGAAEAGRIIANRPYLTKTELVSKNVLPVGPFLALKPLVVAMPATMAKGRP